MTTSPSTPSPMDELVAISQQLSEAEKKVSLLRTKRNNTIAQLCTKGGHSYADVARTLGVSRQSVQRIGSCQVG